MVVVLGVGGLVVAVGLDKDMVTGERTGERALTLARSPRPFASCHVKSRPWG